VNERPVVNKRPQRTVGAGCPGLQHRYPVRVPEGSGDGGSSQEVDPRSAGAACRYRRGRRGDEHGRVRDGSSMHPWTETKYTMITRHPGSSETPDLPGL